MAKLLSSLATDVVRFNLGGLLATVVGLVDVLSGQRLGTGVDVSLVVGGLAALGVHVADNVAASK